MKIFLSIDDTDDLESKGTGEIAQEISKLIEEKAIGKTSAVTRHQLYVHEDIPYTSHNSSMCFEIENVREEDYDLLVELASSHLKKESSPLSDPGLCICRVDEVDKDKLIKYGQDAKKIVLNKKIAYDFANEQGIFLQEYGGTGDGVIGALAGVGLRLSGHDGRFKGKHKIEEGIYSAAKLLDRGDIDKIYDIGSGKYISDEVIELSGKIKTVFLDHSRVLPVYRDEEVYKNCIREQLRRF